MAAKYLTSNFSTLKTPSAFRVEKLFVAKPASDE
jgi:hypothetical protein